MGFTLLDSKKIFKGKVFNVRQDQVRMPNGKSARVDVVEHAASVTLLPVDDQGKVWFIRQYRHPAGQELLELPAGVLDEDEDPADGAGRELREEIGMAALSLVEIGKFFLVPGYSTEFMHVFLATGLYEAPLDQDEDEFLSVEKLGVREAYDMAEAGELRDGKSIAALMLARAHLSLLDEG